MFEISKDFAFEAAHSLPHLPTGHKCRRLHGHSYRFRVVVRGELDERGFVLDYAEIKAAVEPLLKRLDHQTLDEVLDFHTTAENLARWLFDMLAPLLNKPECYWLERIEFFETASTCVIFPA